MLRASRCEAFLLQFAGMRVLWFSVESDDSGIMDNHLRLPEAPAVSANTVPRGWRRFVVPSLSDAVFALVSALALAMGGALSNRDGDLGRHLQLGSRILDTGSIPTTDIYSYTSAGGTMVPHEWIAQVVYAAAFDVWGFDGVALVVLVAVALSWAITTRLLLSRGIRATAVLATVVVAAASSMIHWATRPHVFTFVFIVIWVALLDDLRAGKRDHVWWVIPLTIVWANTHGAFIVGFVLIATYLVGGILDRHLGIDNHASSRHLGMALGGSIIAALVNPVGTRLITNSFAYIGEDFLHDFTSEYNSPDFHQRAFWPFAALLFAAILLKWAKTPTNILLVTSWAAFGLYSFRNIPIFALVTAPILAVGVDQLLAQFAGHVRHRLPKRWGDPSWAGMHRAVAGGTMAFILLASIAFALDRDPGSSFQFSPDVFPVEALLELEGNYPGQRVFNQFEWGGYLLYCCWPEIDVFIDGQTDYYGPELTMEYDRVVEGLPGWDDVLERYDVDWVLIRSEKPLAQILTASPDWTRLHHDRTASVFVINR